MDAADKVREDMTLSVVKTELLKKGSRAFKLRCERAFRDIAEKYAWVAQQEGIVLRRNPLKLRPHRDYVFNRIAKAEYGFPYLDSNGRKRFWAPDFEDVLGLTLEGELDFGFTIAERIEFLPSQPEITKDADGCRVLNLWRPPQWQVVGNAEAPTPFLAHLDYLFDNDQTAVDHVLDFLAHLLQRPSERVGHALLFTSEAKGIGKSTLGNIVRSLVGEHNARVAHTKDLKGQFDGWLMGNLVVQVDEVYESGNWDLANKLKPLITEQTVSVNIKYGPQLEIQNYARLLLFSNHTAPLSLEDGDRRYFVFNSAAQPRDDDYYEALNSFIQHNDGMNAVFTYLMQRDLSAFNPYRRPPMTAAKRAVIEASSHPIRTYISEAVQSGHFRDELGDTFTFDALQRLLQRDGYGAHAKNAKELGDALKLAGVTQIRRTVEGRKHRFYQLPPSDDPEPDTDF